MVATTNRIKEHTFTGTGQRPREGKVTRRTEAVTGRIPSLAFLTGAAISMALSLGLQVSGRDRLSLFIGQWVPSFMVLGLYNKIVKVAGSDRSS
jgi:hypothetical protein